MAEARDSGEAEAKEAEEYEDADDGDEHGGEQKEGGGRGAEDGGDEAEDDSDDGQWGPQCACTSMVSSAGLMGGTFEVCRWAPSPYLIEQNIRIVGVRSGP